MAGKVLTLEDIDVVKDQLGCQIATFWVEWNALRQNKIKDWKEIRQYLFATDTTTTTNSKLPWKNKTTIPKLCQIRDNLHANYMQSLFPKRNWLEWEANEEDSNSKSKRDAILNYMKWACRQNYFKNEMSKVVYDYIDYGNAFVMPEWVDERSQISEPPLKTGYVGPTLRRISPLDIVFNPTAPSFREAPKIIRSIVSLGEIKKILEQQSTEENKKAYEDLYKYLIKIRANARNLGGADLDTLDSYFQVDGFSSYRNYLESDYVEILTFYGDIFDWKTEEYIHNHKIMVVDRHKVISKVPNPSYFGYAPIFHVGWRIRQDNLWAMGPLDNLVGLQYRIDHVENLKADVFDLITFPVFKIKGFSDDFTWEPGARINVSEEGDVDMVAPPFQVLQNNVEIQSYANTMEEMAGAPKEAMGIRSPGEKTAYEVQRLENASSRIFQAKIHQFEDLEEDGLNGMLEMARRNIGTVQEISVFDDDFKIQTFMKLTPQDITGAGRIRPVAARHFAEKAEMVQNITSLYASGVAKDPGVMQHMSGLKIARMFEYLLGLSDWRVVSPYIRIAEDADAQRLANAAQEQVMVEQQTPGGLTPDDYHPDPAEIDQQTAGAAAIAQQQ